MLCRVIEEFFHLGREGLPKVSKHALKLITGHQVRLPLTRGLISVFVPAPRQSFLKLTEFIEGPDFVLYLKLGRSRRLLSCYRH